MNEQEQQAYQLRLRQSTEGANGAPSYVPNVNVVGDRVTLSNQARFGDMVTVTPRVNLDRSNGDPAQRIVSGGVDVNGKTNLHGVMLEALLKRGIGSEPAALDYSNGLAASFKLPNGGVDAHYTKFGNPATDMNGTNVSVNGQAGDFSGGYRKDSVTTDGRNQQNIQAKVGYQVTPELRFDANQTRSTMQGMDPYSSRTLAANYAISDGFDVGANYTRDSMGATNAGIKLNGRW